ncbi:MAG TPA: hypothetical protein P5528_10160 [Steroidobacteraceae bacterium]|nr:hypothetical protein [Steroidobacteraceae bacterium]HRX89797.1 hypothetical protein [Steroidobacteraceae bacterium]
MKSASFLAIAGLLAMGVAFAGTPPASLPATSATTSPPASTTLSKSADCDKQAAAKKLEGKAREKFVESCKKDDKQDKKSY